MFDFTQLDTKLIKRLKAYRLRRALAHPDRYRIVELLHRKGNLHLGDILMDLRIGQRKGKSHIAALRRLGILQRQPDSTRLALSGQAKPYLKDILKDASSN